MSDGSRPVAPHRGTMILVFGILGLIGCFPLGICAWVMGNADLAAMQRGEMDRSGEGMTQAGKVMGMIECGLFVLGVLFGIAFVVLGLGAAATMHK